MYTIKKGYMEDRFSNIDVKAIINKLKKENRSCKLCGGSTQKRGDNYKTFCTVDCQKKYKLNKKY